VYSPCCKYPRWRKNRSRRLKISYLSKSLLYSRGGGGRVTLTSSHPPPPPYPSSDPSDISYKRRHNRSSPPKCFLQSSHSCFLHVDLGTPTIERLPFFKLNILWTEEQLTCLVSESVTFYKVSQKFAYWISSPLYSFSHAFSHVRCSC
jgi:hypothetical protein